jgi:hypothetical protein
MPLAILSYCNYRKDKKSIIKMPHAEKALLKISMDNLYPCSVRLLGVRPDWTGMRIFL